MPKPSPAVEPTKVFISYSREDSQRVAALVQALEAQSEFRILQDTVDILPTEEWKERLRNLIGESDTIVVCLSPDAAASTVCAWEVETALSLKKRIAPVVIRRLDGSAPSTIAKFNYIFAVEPYQLDGAVADLVRAINTDIAWIREHTRIGERARRWSLNNRPNDDLLRGTAIDAVEQWVKYRPTSAPELTTDTTDYIAASRQDAIDAARRRRKSRNALVALAATVVGVVGLAYAGFLNATYLEGLANGIRNRWHDARMIPGSIRRDCPSIHCPEMVLLPPGEFMMGAPTTETEQRSDEVPRHRVKIASPFWVAKYETTFAEWDACHAAGGCSFLPKDQGWGRGLRPVVNVTWNDVQQYLTWLSIKTGVPYRLLTEAQWEYAARAVVSADQAHPRYFWGDDVGIGNAQCTGCFGAEQRKQTVPVGSFKANGFNLHDMHGNVWEWVQDCHTSAYSDVKSEIAPAPAQNCFRVARGGSWANGPANMRAAFRNRFQPGAPFSNLGFRVARPLLMTP